MCSKILFDFLIEELVTKNGAGHKQLKEHVDNGSITELDAEIIKLRANVKMMSNKLAAMVD